MIAKIQLQRYAGLKNGMNKYLILTMVITITTTVRMSKSILQIRPALEVRKLLLRNVRAKSNR